MILKFFLLLFLLLPVKVFSQDSAKTNTPKIENMLFGLQLGIISPWITAEFGLSENVSLEAEAGLFSVFATNTNDVTIGSFLVVGIEPRWYYFLAQENHFSKNSGDFLTMKVYVQLPAGFYINSKEKDPRFPSTSIAFIPKWGHRRTLWEHFTYEVGIGLGMVYAPEWLSTVSALFALNRNIGITMDVHLRVGYTF